MKYVILIIVLVAAAVLGYKHYVGGSVISEVNTVRATGVAGSIGKGGRRVGKKTSDAFRKVDFGR